jgi:hypothetical protein
MASQGNSASTSEIQTTSRTAPLTAKPLFGRSAKLDGFPLALHRMD